MHSVWLPGNGGGPADDGQAPAREWEVVGQASAPLHHPAQWQGHWPHHQDPGGLATLL